MYFHGHSSCAPTHSSETRNATCSRKSSLRCILSKDDGFLVSFSNDGWQLKSLQAFISCLVGEDVHAFACLDVVLVLHAMFTVNPSLPGRVLIDRGAAVYCPSFWGCGSLGSRAWTVEQVPPHPHHPTIYKNALPVASAYTLRWICLGKQLH